jgi:hypothetical protein
MRSAQELCALLITKGIKNLSDDEEEIVVDYLDSIGVEVSLDDKPRDMCQTLLRKMMEEKSDRPIPITAFANKVLEKSQKERVKKEETRAKRREEENIRKREIDIRTKRVNDELGFDRMKNRLPGCQQANGIFNQDRYDIQVDYDLGIQELSDGNYQYKAVISLPSDLISQIYGFSDNPIIEIRVGNNTAYARIEGVSEDVITISKLVGDILKLREPFANAVLRLCRTMPIIQSVVFTYYGSQEELDSILPNLINRLPETINAFSYLSLGLLLRTVVDGVETIVRVDRLVDNNGDLVFSGLIPFGDSELPFEINAEY